VRRDVLNEWDSDSLVWHAATVAELEVLHAIAREIHSQVLGSRRRAGVASTASGAAGDQLRGRLLAIVDLLDAEPPDMRGIAAILRGALEEIEAAP
jgi:hypothetical protein